MLLQFFTLGCIMLFAVMTPGPDFALVTKNTLLHSRRAGIFTALGIGTCNLIHISYCALGLAIIIVQSALIFTLVKYSGAFYLIYLGIQALRTQASAPLTTDSIRTIKKPIADFTAFRQGFLCNLFNPKATLFFLALFTTLIKPDTPPYLLISYIIEMLSISLLWFCSLTFILSHPRVAHLLARAEIYIAKTLGIFLIGFGILLAVAK